MMRSSYGVIILTLLKLSNCYGTTQSLFQETSERGFDGLLETLNDLRQHVVAVTEVENHDRIQRRWERNNHNSLLRTEPARFEPITDTFLWGDLLAQLSSDPVNAVGPTGTLVQNRVYSLQEVVKLLAHITTTMPLHTSKRYELLRAHLFYNHYLTKTSRHLAAHPNSDPPVEYAFPSTVFEEEMAFLQQPLSLSSAEHAILQETVYRMIAKGQYGTAASEGNGSNPVVNFNGLHFKRHIGRAEAFEPAVEQAMYSFYYLLTHVRMLNNVATTRSLALTPSLLLLCKGKHKYPPPDFKEAFALHVATERDPQDFFKNHPRANFSEQTECYLVQVSKTVVGQPLKCFLEDVNPNYDRIDPFSFGILVLGGLITCPSDYHADNFIVTGDLQHRTIVGIDNDKAFAFAPFQQYAQNRYRIHHKNILYCLPLMDREIHNDIKAFILSADFALIVCRWAQFLIFCNMNTREIYQHEIFLHTETQIEGGLNIPLRLPVGSLKKMQALCDKIIALLNKNDHHMAGAGLTYKDIFNALHPELFAQYQGFIATYQQEGPVEIYSHIHRDDILPFGMMETPNALALIERGETLAYTMTISEAITELKTHLCSTDRQHWNFLKFQPSNRENLVGMELPHSIHLVNDTSEAQREERQKKMLESVVKSNNLRKIYLKRVLYFPPSLSETFWQRLCELHVEYVDKNIKFDLTNLQEIARQCKQLKLLSLASVPKIVNIVGNSGPLLFQSLRQLICRDLSLEEFNVQSANSGSNKLQVHFIGCSLSDPWSMQGGAQMLFTGGTITGRRGVRYVAANFDGSHMQRVNFSDAILRASVFKFVDFSTTVLRGIDIDKTCNFTGAFFRAANLSNAVCNDAEANPPTLNFSATDFGGANLDSVKFAYTNFRGANFTHANLRAANLTYSELQNANFSYANLSLANLEGAHLQGALFYCANLYKAKIPYVYKADIEKITANVHEVSWV